MAGENDNPSRRRLLAALVTSAFFACQKQAELPSLGTVPEFALVDQAGRATRAASLRGKVWAAAFMFTRCPTICPRITRRMRELQVAAEGSNVAVELVSFSVDPEYDTPPVLEAYAREHAADLRSWRFLTGDIETVKRVAMEGFKMALEGKATPNTDHLGILHGSHLVLVDRSLHVRGYYRTSDDTEMARLLRDARSLLAAS